MAVVFPQPAFQRLAGVPPVTPHLQVVCPPPTAPGPHRYQELVDLETPKQKPNNKKPQRPRKSDPSQLPRKRCRE